MKNNNNVVNQSIDLSLNKDKDDKTSNSSSILGKHLRTKI
jgi:hypothetical protein